MYTRQQICAALPQQKIAPLPKAPPETFGCPIRAEASCSMGGDVIRQCYCFSFPISTTPAKLPTMRLLHHRAAIVLLSVTASLFAAPNNPQRPTSPNDRWSASLQHDPIENRDLASYTFHVGNGAYLQANCTPDGRFLDAWVHLPDRIYKRHFWHHMVQKLTVDVRLDEHRTTMAWYPEDDHRRLTLGHRDLEKLTSADTAIIEFEAKGGKYDTIIFGFGHAPFACPTAQPQTQSPSQAVTQLPPIAPPPPPAQ